MQAWIRSVIDRFARAWAAVTDAGVRYSGAIAGAFVLLAIVWLVSGPVTLALPQSCGACHGGTDGEYTDWLDSSHASVDCRSCHEDRGYIFGLGNSVALASDLRKLAFGGHADPAWISNEACLNCHAEITEGEAVVVGTLRMSHVGLQDGGYRCVDCHADAAHKVDVDMIAEPTMGTCAACHNGVKASAQCVTCHPDAVGETAEKRHDAEWARTHGPDWEKLHGMGELATCSLCHTPDKCEGCHGIPLPHDSGFAATHGQSAIVSREPCETCHTAAFCDSCHGLEMPHPADFLPKHREEIETVDDPLCARCHTTANCNECHIKHIHPGVPNPMRAPKRDF